METDDPPRLVRDAGFTLVEALLATALLTGAFAGVARLVVATAGVTLNARSTSFSGVLATQKLYELTTVPLPDLAPSAPDAWASSVAGHVEQLDASGVVVGTGPTPPGNAQYVRRWSVTPLAGDPSGGVILQVSAGPLRRDAGGLAMDARPHEVARAVGVRTGLAP